MKFIGKLFLNSFLVIIFLLFILENSFFVYDFFFSKPWQMGAKFDKDKCITYDRIGFTIKGNMMHDLLTNYLHLGMDRKNIEQLINKGFSSGKHFELYNIEDCPEVMSLAITYDENNKLETASYFIESR